VIPLWLPIALYAASGVVTVLGVVLMIVSNFDCADAMKKDGP
jgi:hypothetical protein